MSEIHCPVTLPIDTAVLKADHKSELRELADSLEEGHYVSYQGNWPKAVQLFRELKKQLLQSAQNRSHEKRVNAKAHLHRMASQFLIPVNDGEIALPKAPDIGWLGRFYQGEFYLPVNDLLGLNSSWQWYTKGVEYSALRSTLHPFYGVYFPTRHVHLHLFEDWLMENKPKTAMDVGCGCGVLTFMLAIQGCQQIHATDIVPNAIVGMDEEIERQRTDAKITAGESNLFPDEAEPVDCIVFNPPWLPGNIHSITDHGSYYAEPVISDFLDRAGQFLTPNGEVILLFSSLAQDLGLTQENLVETTLEKHPEWKLHSKQTAKEHPPAKKTRRQWVKKTRAVEEVQLWVLRRS